MGQASHHRGEFTILRVQTYEKYVSQTEARDRFGMQKRSIDDREMLKLDFRVIGRCERALAVYFFSPNICVVAYVSHLHSLLIDRRCGDSDSEFWMRNGMNECKWQYLTKMPFDDDIHSIGACAANSRGIILYSLFALMYDCHDTIDWKFFLSNVSLSRARARVHTKTSYGRRRSTSAVAKSNGFRILVWANEFCMSASSIVQAQAHEKKKSAVQPDKNKELPISCIAHRVLRRWFKPYKKSVFRRFQSFFAADIHTHTHTHIEQYMIVCSSMLLICWMHSRRETRFYSI